MRHKIDPPYMRNHMKVRHSYVCQLVTKWATQIIRIECRTPYTLLRIFNTDRKPDLPVVFHGTHRKCKIHHSSWYYMTKRPLSLTQIEMMVFP